MTSSSTRFGVFSVLYMTAFLLEVIQDWDLSVYPVLFLVLVTVIVFRGVTPYRFLFFLAAASAYFLLLHFPEVANHVNLMLLCNLALIVGLARPLALGRSVIDEDTFDALVPPLRAALVLVYFIAGFHKLNRDFFNPEVSCAGGFAGEMLSVLISRVQGIPVVAILLIAITWALYRFLKLRRPDRNESRAAKPTLLTAAATATLVMALLGVIATTGLPAPLKKGAILAAATIIVSWETIGALLLTVPRMQAPVLLFSLGMHAALAPIGFVDFGALAVALMSTFVPRSKFELWQRDATLHVGPFRLRRLYLYYAINAGLLSALLVLFSGRFDNNITAGLLFNLATLLLVWPFLANASRARWSGVRVWSQATPTYMAVVPLVILLHGATSYLGLRSAGNFSMFSNLRTEGEASNHLLLPGNPLKVWDYQEDVVLFIDIDDEQARIGHKYRPLRGSKLPVVEFRKLIHKWTEARRSVPLTFEYQGRRHSTRNIVKDPAWRTERRDAEMWLLDFRVIQPVGPNLCRW